MYNGMLLILICNHSKNNVICVNNSKKMFKNFLSFEKPIPEFYIQVFLVVVEKERISIAELANKMKISISYTSKIICDLTSKRFLVKRIKENKIIELYLT